MRNKASKIISVILILVMLMTFAGCGSGISNSGATKTVTDSFGREVEIPESPENVACLYATAAHMMAMLDEGDKIVGCPNGVKSDVLMQMKYPEITETATPHQEGSINAEEMLSIDADLAIVSGALASSEGEMEKLDDMGIPYIVLDYDNIQQLREAITIMGEVFDKQDQASKYIAFYDDTLAMVDERLKDVDMADAPNVYHSLNEATRTDPEGTICSEIMERAKVKDVSIEKGSFSKNEKNIYVTLEEIYKWNPDAFIVNEYPVKEYIMADTKWAGLRAVKENKVYSLPVGATRWCHPGSMEAHMGVLAVARQFYPEKFKDLDFKEYIADYYDEYFNMKLDDDTVDRIIKGEGMHKFNGKTK